MKYLSKSVEDTFEIAKSVAAVLCGGEVLLLNGELGAGKTTFTKGLVKALGCDEAVTSPTFTIMHAYEGGRLDVYHFDMYRILSADELFELGFDDYVFGDGVSVVEWNKLVDLPKKVITINIVRTNNFEREFEII